MPQLNCKICGQLALAIGPAVDAEHTTNIRATTHSLLSYCTFKRALTHPVIHTTPNYRKNNTSLLNNSFLHIYTRGSKYVCAFANFSTQICSLTTHKMLVYISCSAPSLRIHRYQFYLSHWVEHSLFSSYIIIEYLLQYGGRLADGDGDGMSACVFLVLSHPDSAV